MKHHITTAFSSSASYVVETSVKREWLLTKRNGPWERERGKAKFSPCRLSLHANFIERETSGNEEDIMKFQGLVVQEK